MENQYSFTLIDGKFKPSDASEILFSLINNKIKFHQLEVFSMEERFDGDISCSAKRIDELHKSFDSLQHYLQWASEHGFELKISGEIKLIPINN